MENLTKEIILKRLHEHRKEIKQFGVKKLILFGSFARDEQNENSDIDFLVEYEKDRGLFRDSVGLLQLLRDKIFNRKIDLVKPNLIREELKDEILGGIQHVAEI